MTEQERIDKLFERMTADLKKLYEAVCTENEVPEPDPEVWSDQIIELRKNYQRDSEKLVPHVPADMRRHIIDTAWKRALHFQITNLTSCSNVWSREPWLQKPQMT